MNVFSNDRRTFSVQSNKSFWTSFKQCMNQIFINIQEMQLRRAKQRIRNKIYF